MANFGCLECQRLNQRRLLSSSEDYRVKQLAAAKAWKATPAGRAAARKHDAIKRRKNPDKERERMRLLMRKKRASSVQYKIQQAVSGQINYHIGKGGKSTSQLLQERCGYTVQELMRHLEKQFTAGMEWANYGKHGWHIDHIIPASSFDLTNPAEFGACWGLGNLRPLWGKENSAKCAKHLFLI